jgi:hypothetical protein
LIDKIFLYFREMKTLLFFGVLCFFLSCEKNKNLISYQCKCYKTGFVKGKTDTSKSEYNTIHYIEEISYKYHYVLYNEDKLTFIDKIILNDKLSFYGSINTFPINDTGNVKGTFSDDLQNFYYVYTKHNIYNSLVQVDSCNCIKM